MVDLPPAGEGLSWIATQDLTCLLLIPDLQPISIAAAAAGGPAGACIPALHGPAPSWSCHLLMQSEPF